MILELVLPRANWFAGLEVAMTRPPGVPERRGDEDPWHPEPSDRPRRIADDLAWFRYAMDRPAEHGLQPLDEALSGTWNAGADRETGERLRRLDERGVLTAAGFTLHHPDPAWRSPATGTGTTMSDEHTTDEGQDAGGRAHTGLDEPHPAGDGPRSDRDVGGPTSAGEVQEGDVEGGHGDRPAPFEPHES